MTHKGERPIHAVVAFSVFDVERVSAADKRLGLRPVAVQTVHSHLLRLPVDGHAFVQAFLVEAKPSVENAQVLVLALDDLDSVCVQLFNRAHRDSGAV